MKPQSSFLTLIFSLSVIALVLFSCAKEELLPFLNKSKIDTEQIIDKAIVSTPASTSLKNNLQNEKEFVVNMTPEEPQLLHCNISLNSPSIDAPVECGFKGLIRHFDPPEGGTAPYKGFWTDEDGNEFRPGTFGWSYFYAPDGIYVLTITDASRCTAKFTYEIIAENAILVGFSNTFPTYGTSNNGSAEIGVYSQNQTGGPYTFTWSNGKITTSDNQSRIKSLSSGTYTVTVSGESSPCEIIRKLVVKTVSTDMP
jgi:hypothetical protein